MHTYKGIQVHFNNNTQGNVLPIKCQVIILIDTSSLEAFIYLPGHRNNDKLYCSLNITYIDIYNYAHKLDTKIKKKCTLYLCIKKKYFEFFDGFVLV